MTLLGNVSYVNELISYDKTPVSKQMCKCTVFPITCIINIALYFWKLVLANLFNQLSDLK